MHRSLTLIALILLGSWQTQAGMLKHRIDCEGVSAQGEPVQFSVDQIGNKDSWDTVTANVYASKAEQKTLLCEEAWFAGRQGIVIDDDIGIENDLYVECGGERANEVHYRISLNKTGEQSYSGTFEVGEGLSPFGISRFGGTQSLTCTKVQK